MSENKYVYCVDYEMELASVKQSRKSKSSAYCCYCDNEIINQFANHGKTAISAYNATTKHKNFV